MYLGMVVRYSTLTLMGRCGAVAVSLVRLSCCWLETTPRDHSVSSRASRSAVLLSWSIGGHGPGGTRQDTLHLV